MIDIKNRCDIIDKRLKELKFRLEKYMVDVEERFEDEFDRESQQFVYIIDEGQEMGAPHYSFLFTDKEILKRIRFKTFMKCCRAAEQTDHTILFRKLENEKKLLTEFLHQQYKLL